MKGRDGPALVYFWFLIDEHRSCANELQWSRRLRLRFCALVWLRLLVCFAIAVDEVGCETDDG